WWEAELEVVKPKVLGVMGSVAAKAVLGPSFLVTKERGKWFDYNGIAVLATVHPSAVLRAQDRYQKEYDTFVADLRKMLTGTSGR
ncbi:MAG TPA: uracil-DNA glycosylase family protein, partial [Acidimicrobiia bacterium]|nr:uracil-DNA glycosylase family protein [Acidimicrobiia bacterium]